jgi:hypothetical protein
MGQNRITQNILVSKVEGEMPLGRRKSRRKDKTKTDLKRTALGRADWIYLAQDRDK